MKKIKLIIGTAIFAVMNLAAFAQTNTNTGVTLTPEQLAKLDGSIHDLIPLVPAQYQGAVASFIAIMGLLAMAGRVVVGWRSSGFLGAIGGLFGGTNSPSNQTTKPATALKVLLCLALPALLFTGCAGTQVFNVSKGTGLDADIPVGYNGANLFELRLKIGQFITSTGVQPVSTNKVYVPSLAVASTTDGALTAPTLTGAPTAGATANVTGGDKYLVTVGSGEGSVTNLAGIATSAAH